MSGVFSLHRWEVGGTNPFFLIAGPCVIESESHCFELAAQLKEISGRVGVPLVFKASYDKANRTSIESYRGPGLETGLRVLQRIKQELDLPVLSDVHEVAQVVPASEVLDVIQIPAFLCRQTDLVCAAAATRCVINVKKGQFQAPWDVENVLAKVRAAGNQRVMVTERGSCFGYNNLVVDMRSLPQLRALGSPVVFDTTHSVQLPGGSGTKSAGQAEFIPFLSRAAVAAGVDGLFCEVHEQPEIALSDGANALRLDLLEGILRQWLELDRMVKRWWRADVARDRT
jgi:2-dehydro-3-deoxyphosphooctonate aldolase (KDO 8-P synthase)